MAVRPDPRGVATAECEAAANCLYTSQQVVLRSADCRFVRRNPSQVQNCLAVAASLQAGQFLVDHSRQDLSEPGSESDFHTGLAVQRHGGVVAGQSAAVVEFGSNSGSSTFRSRGSCWGKRCPRTVCMSEPVALEVKYRSDDRS